MVSVTLPKILVSKPQPRLTMKTFHKTKIQGWEGLAKLETVQGWAANRRIELFRRECEMQFGRLPTNDEIYDYMCNDDEEFHIRDLARSIMYNGVKVPIILDAQGTLLDGNRRYVATRYALEHNKDTALKAELELIPVWVLSEDASDEDKRKVLVECNFLTDWKVAWPPYIKAAAIYEDHTDQGIGIDDLVERYGLKKGEIRKIIQVTGLIHEFLEYKDHTDEAFQVAYKHYPYFEEAHNKYRAKLDGDPDFKEQFFDWLNSGKFFKSITQVRHLAEIRDNEEAWAMIHSGVPNAVDAAVHIVQGEKLPSNADGEKKVLKVIRVLRDLKEREINSIQPGTLIDLEKALNEVIKMAKSVTT